MGDIFRFADELGPAKVIHVYEPLVGLKAVLVVDNVARGPAIGGLRIAHDVSPEECFRLAHAMTLKNVAADLPHGGGKSVIEGANIPITDGAEKYLHAKGMLYVPDSIANAGGVICAAMEYQRACQSLAFQAIEEKLRHNTWLVLEEASSRGILPREAAVDLAVQRLKKSMSYRRWSLFSSAPGFV